MTGFAKVSHPVQKSGRVAHRVVAHAALQRKDKRRKEAKKHNLKQVPHIFSVFVWPAPICSVFVWPAPFRLPPTRDNSLTTHFRHGKKNCTTKAYAGKCSLGGKPIFRDISDSSLIDAFSIKKMKEITRTVARVREFVQDLPSTTIQV